MPLRNKHDCELNRNQKLFLYSPLRICDYGLNRCYGSERKSQDIRCSRWKPLEIGEGTLFMESREQEAIYLEKSLEFANIEEECGTTEIL